MGVDLSDPGFWSSGLDLIERQLEAAEAAAAEAGRTLTEAPGGPTLVDGARGAPRRRDRAHPARATRRRCSPRRRSSTRSSCPTGPSCGRAAWRWPTTSRARSLRGARTLELGCGLALPSIAAARAGGRVLATDWSPDAVSGRGANARRNGVEIETLVCDWAAPAPLLERAPVPARAGLRRALRAAQRGPAPGPAAAARGRARAGSCWPIPGGRPAERFLEGARAHFEVTTTMSPRFPRVAIHRLRGRSAERDVDLARGRPRRAGGSRGGSSRSGAWKASSSVAKPVTTVSIPRARQLRQHRDRAAARGRTPARCRRRAPSRRRRAEAPGARGRTRRARPARTPPTPRRPAARPTRSIRSSSAADRLGALPRRPAAR